MLAYLSIITGIKIMRFKALLAVYSITITDTIRTFNTSKIPLFSGLTEGVF